MLQPMNIMVIKQQMVNIPLFGQLQKKRIFKRLLMARIHVWSNYDLPQVDLCMLFRLMLIDMKEGCDATVSCYCILLPTRPTMALPVTIFITIILPGFISISDTKYFKQPHKGCLPKKCTWYGKNYDGCSQKIAGTGFMWKHYQSLWLGVGD